MEKRYARSTQKTGSILPLCPIIGRPAELFGVANGNYAVDNKFTITAPWDGAEIFFVMQFHFLAAIAHERVSNAFVFDGKFKLVRLHGARRCGTKSTLDQFPFISFEYVPFSDYII